MSCVSSSRSIQRLLQTCCSTATGCGCNTSAYFASSCSDCYPADNNEPRNATLCDALSALDGFSGATGTFIPALTSVITTSSACNCFTGAIYQYLSENGQLITTAGSPSIPFPLQAVLCGATGSTNFNGATPSLSFQGNNTFLAAFPSGQVPPQYYGGATMRFEYYPLLKCFIYKI